MAPLNLPLGATGVKVVVQPVVLFNICDSYIRRGDGQTRVIGTLLGTIEAGVVEIRTSYAVPHIETPETVSIDIPHHRTLFDLHQKVNQKEVVLGWYSTGLGLTGSDALIQDFYAGESTNPIHLIVDTNLTDQRLVIKAYVSRTLTLKRHQEPPLATEFQEVPCEVRTAEVEKIGVELLSSTRTEKMPADAEGLSQSIERLQSSIEHAYRYVDDVVEGRRKGDRAVGRYLADTVDAVPLLERGEVDALFQSGTHDVLLVMYLANLVRTHVALADKLGTLALPLV